LLLCNVQLRLANDLKKYFVKNLLKSGIRHQGAGWSGKVSDQVSDRDLEIFFRFWFMLAGGLNFG